MRRNSGSGSAGGPRRSARPRPAGSRRPCRRHNPACRCAARSGSCRRTAPSRRRCSPPRRRCQVRPPMPWSSGMSSRRSSSSDGANAPGTSCRHGASRHRPSTDAACACCLVLHGPTGLLLRQPGERCLRFRPSVNGLPQHFASSMMQNATQIDGITSWFRFPGSRPRTERSADRACAPCRCRASRSPWRSAVSPDPGSGCPERR